MAGSPNSNDHNLPRVVLTADAFTRAGLRRAHPWWNGTRKVTAQELREGAECVKDLIGLLPALRVVVLVGSKAARARPFLEAMGSALLTSAHPSPIVSASFRNRWDTIPAEWAKVMTAITPLK